MKRLWLILPVISLVVAQQNEVITDRYPSGVKKSITVYEGKGSKEKLVQKLGYYESGNLMFRTDWENGKRNGVVFVYYESENQITGEIGISGFYDNDSLSGVITITEKNRKIAEGSLGRKKYEMPLWVSVIEDSVEREKMASTMLGKNWRTSRYVSKTGIWKYWNIEGELFAEKSYDGVEDYYELSMSSFHYNEISLAALLLSMVEYNYDYLAWEKDLDDI